MWLDTQKNQGSLAASGGNSWNTVSSCVLKNIHRSGLWKRRAKPFCQEIEENNFFILVVKLLHTESHHSEPSSSLLLPKAARGSSSALWENAGGSGFLAGVRVAWNE